jgi:protein phosphatase 4 regulatory subunit 3
MAKLIARSEENPQEIILQFYIRGEDVYQRQQGMSMNLFHPFFSLTSIFSSLETLIVWTEPDGTDYALSFQDIEGCADVWEYILDVQRAINGDRDRGTHSTVLRKL